VLYLHTMLQGEENPVKPITACIVITYTDFYFFNLWGGDLPCRHVEAVFYLSLTQYTGIRRATLAAPP
jgi:hypothetical protein